MKTEPSEQDLIKMATHRLQGHRLYWVDAFRKPRRRAIRCLNCRNIVADGFHHATKHPGVLEMDALWPHLGFSRSKP